MRIIQPSCNTQLFRKNPDNLSITDLMLKNFHRSFQNSREIGLFEFFRMTITVLKTYFKKGTPKQIASNQPVSCNFVKKETLAQLFSCEFQEISKNIFFTEHLRATASLETVKTSPIIFSGYSFLTNLLRCKYLIKRILYRLIQMFIFDKCAPKKTKYVKAN